MQSFNKIIFLIVLTVFSSNIFAKDLEDSEIYFFENFIIGKYQIIGKALNSKQTYLGEFEIKNEKGDLIFIKKLDGNTTRGKAHIEKSMGGSAKVLKLSYNYLKQFFEETCLFKTDLDNYPRITCHVYEKGIATTSPGLEAMFIIHEE